MRRSLRSFATLLGFGLAACGGLVNGQDLPDGSAGAGGFPGSTEAGGSPTTTPVGGSASLCPGAGGANMVRLPEGYCIDSTETTRADYQAWLASGPNPAAQDPTSCGWNTSFVPDASCMSAADVCRGSACGKHPQVCLDWCDAYAYCQGVGKRLCGRIGGGPNGFNDDFDPTLSQWFNACSSHGENEYPYGRSAFVSNACNGAELGLGTTVPVGSLAGCQSGEPSYAGVYDLAGNVWEWEDSCAKVDDSDFCHLRGGSFKSYYYAIPCGVDGYTGRRTQYPNVGVRCCAP